MCTDAPLRHRVFTAARNGMVHGVAEVSEGADQRAELQMFYVIPSSRGAAGPAGPLVDELKRCFPLLRHTGDLSPSGRKLVGRYDIPRRAKKNYKRDAVTRRRVEVPDGELSEEQAEALGRTLLADANAGRDIGPVRGRPWPRVL